MGREGEYGEFGEGNGVKAWQQLSLGDIADIQTGPFGSQLHAADYVDSGIPSIMPTNIGNRLEIRTEGIACIKEADAQRLERYLVRVNDVVYSRRGDVEKCAFITSRENGWLCGTGCLRVRFTSNEVKPKFCAYYLSTEEIRGWVKGHAIGTTMPNLNSSILQRLPLLLPPVPEQEAIIAVLGNLDAKIDLLHRQNTTLEAMAETLFRQWFVEGASANWEGGVVDALIEFNPSRKLKKGTVAPYLEMASLSNSTFNPDDWYDREFSSGTKFVNGDTLLARITPCLENGKTAYVTFLDEGQVGWGSTEYIVMRPRPGLHPFFAYALARNSEFRDYAEGCLAGSSGRQRVDTDHLRQYAIRIPSAEAAARFNAFAEATTPKLHANFLHIRTLESLRDTLLPKLMSGEVRVRYDAKA
ncbi:MAG: restriction endonuclease subunit S [Rhodocyclaceae bacterium]|jgi:type I restriction enzyme S subunit|nr:restriction endonuclease subunit S [Rhodocyclaceae bacterium]MBK9310254.1 restriction endonuclease subunit S [Rhodocyclaceae bacterium]MBK9954676.1 restriction endonuclease subunit S [Rhodocyclaceae bacterium]